MQLRSIDPNIPLQEFRRNADFASAARRKRYTFNTDATCNDVAVSIVSEGILWSGEAEERKFLVLLDSEVELAMLLKDDVLLDPFPWYRDDDDEDAEDEDEEEEEGGEENEDGDDDEDEEEEEGSESAR